MKFYQAEEYQPICKKRFQHYRCRIQALIPEAIVEHIGASSIPLAVSKGDLDIYVGVDGQELELAIDRLCELGFYKKADTLRTPKLCMLESSHDEDVAFQVVAKGSEFEDFLTFRDKLRNSPTLVQQYNALKLSCRGLTSEIYRQKKSAFIAEVLHQGD